MKGIRNVFVVLLFSLAVTSCYWVPQSTEGSIVVVLGASQEDFNTMTVYPLAKPGKDKTDKPGGEPPAADPEPTFVRVYLYQYQEVEQETGIFAEIAVEMESNGFELLDGPQSMEVKELPVGDGYFARVQLGDWPDGVEGAFRILLADDSQRFKIFDGRVTNIRVSPKRIKEQKE